MSMCTEWRDVESEVSKGWFSSVKGSWSNLICVAYSEIIFSQCITMEILTIRTNLVWGEDQNILICMWWRSHWHRRWSRHTAWWILWVKRTLWVGTWAGGTLHHSCKRKRPVVRNIKTENTSIHSRNTILKNVNLLCLRLCNSGQTLLTLSAL